MTDGGSEEMFISGDFGRKEIPDSYILSFLLYSPLI